MTLVDDEVGSASARRNPAGGPTPALKKGPDLPTSTFPQLPPGTLRDAGDDADTGPIPQAMLVPSVPWKPDLRTVPHMTYEPEATPSDRVELKTLPLQALEEPRTVSGPPPQPGGTTVDVDSQTPAQNAPPPRALPANGAGPHKSSDRIPAGRRATSSETPMAPSGNQTERGVPSFKALEGNVSGTTSLRSPSHERKSGMHEPRPSHPGAREGKRPTGQHPIASPNQIVDADSTTDPRDVVGPRPGRPSAPHAPASPVPRRPSRMIEAQGGPQTNAPAISAPRRPSRMIEAQEDPPTHVLPGKISGPKAVPPPASLEEPGSVEPLTTPARSPAFDPKSGRAVDAGAPLPPELTPVHAVRSPPLLSADTTGEVGNRPPKASSTLGLENPGWTGRIVTLAEDRRMLIGIAAGCALLVVLIGVWVVSLAQSEEPVEDDPGQASPLLPKADKKVVKKKEEPAAAPEVPKSLVVEQTVDAGNGETRTVLSQAGTVRIVTDPDTNIWIDGVDFGPQPKVVTLPAGRQQVLLRNDKLGFKRQVFVDVIPNEQTAQRFKFSMGYIDIDAPRGAKELVDGKVVQGPQVQVWEGTHRVEVIHTDKKHTRAMQAAEVTAGQTISVHFEAPSIADE
jgi:hypothetical protein